MRSGEVEAEARRARQMPVSGYPGNLPEWTVTIILDVAESKSVENASIPRAGIQECHGGQKLQSAGRPDALPT